MKKEKGRATDCRVFCASAKTAGALDLIEMKRSSSRRVALVVIRTSEWQVHQGTVSMVYNIMALLPLSLGVLAIANGSCDLLQASTKKCTCR